MARCTIRENSHSGTYRYENTQIEVFPFFLYEVSLWVRWKNGCAILGSKFIKSNKLISKVVKSKKMKSYTIEKDITLIGAPLEFIQSENLPPYELIKRKAKKK